MKTKETQGLRPFYRPPGYKKIERNESKTKKVNNWYRTDGKEYMSVMFVEVTEDDKLLKMFKETESNHKISDNHRIKFVTKSGIKLKHLLEKKDPFSTECHDNNCQPCVNSKDREVKTLNCKKNRICYEAKCRNCDEEGKSRTYHGETARNLHVRAKEHYSALYNKSDKNFMNKHIMEAHAGNVQEVVFDWKIIGQYQKPLSRQLAEAINIDKKSKEESLNSKHEYFKHSIKKLELNQGENKEECAYCGRKFKKIEDLQTHETEFHMEKKCQHCEYIGIGQKDLTYHTKTKHQQCGIQM